MGCLWKWEEGFEPDEMMTLVNVLGACGGFEPDEMMLVNVLGACGALGLGRWVEGLVLEKKMEVNSYVGSALIVMYGKRGDLISARRVFDSMPNKDVVTWNAIITW